MNKGTKRLATLSVSAGLLLGLGLVQNTNTFETGIVQAATSYKVKLTKTSYVYTSKGKRTTKKIKKGKTVQAYGKKKIKGKWYYKLSKKRYIRVVNAKKVNSVVSPKSNNSNSSNTNSNTVTPNKSQATNTNTTPSSSSSSSSTTPGSSSSGSSTTPSSNPSGSTTPSDFEKKSDADAYFPQLVHGGIVRKDEKIDADKTINMDKLPAGTTAKWESEPNTSTYGETENNKIIVTYPDGSSKTVSGDVYVGYDAEYYHPSAKYTSYETSDGVVYHKVDPGKTFNPEDLVSWGNRKPDKGEYALQWAKDKDGKDEKPDTTTPGVKNYGVEIDYKDGTKDIVRGQFKVKNESEMVDAYSNDGEKYVDEVTPEKLVRFSGDGGEPKTVTSIDWTKDKVGKEVAKPDTTKFDKQQKYSVTITFSDKSTKLVEGNVTVKSDADHYDPEVENQNSVEKDAELKAEDMISNKNDLPKGTKYEWVTKPDTSKTGEDSYYNLKVTYPDGTSETVQVYVYVENTEDED